jgi:glycosyltransferase involved in cell wall biosynthesis
MTAHTAVSVVMPVFNGEQHIREAVQSILGQSLSDFEFLIVNDHSTDSTENIVREYCERDARITALRNEGAKGMVGALNTGLARARGEYIARMDADDISLPTRLERQHDFLDEHRDVSVCGTNMELFGVHQVVWHLPQDHEAIRAGLIFTPFIAHATVMIRRTAIEENQYRYDAGYGYAEDYELWSRLSERYRFANLPDVLYRYRKYGRGDESIRENIRSHSAQRVRLRLLHKLGIVPSPEESELHQQIGDYCYRPTRAFVRRANIWLDKILRANERFQVFDQQALRAHVEERRAEIQGREPARASGIRAFARSITDLPRRMLQRS